MRFLIIVAILFVFIPTDIISAATPADFVACKDGTKCSACDVVDIANKGIVWLFGAVFLLFTYIMIVAGFGLITSAGNTSALEGAKSKFKNGIIGLLIIMSAWIFVDTIMRSIVGGGSGEGVSNAPIGEIKGWGPWSEVQCQTQTPTVKPPVVPVGVTPVTPGVTPVDPAIPPSGTCPITPPTPITDPFALRMEAGERVIYNNSNLQACVAKFKGLVGGTDTSAYRPQAYQTHLYEISTKACALRNNTDPACSALKASIESERSGHGLPVCGAVAERGSTHASGNGVDITGIAHGTPRVQEAAAASCLVWRNYPKDEFHYDLISGCSCN